MKSGDDRANLDLLRKIIFLAAYHSRTGKAHLASSYSIVEILYTLYLKGIMNYRVTEPEWNGRDRLVLSKGHASLALYAVMGMAGFFDTNELESSFCYPNSRFGAEPNMHELSGIEASTGSLGHGISIGIGMAIAGKKDNSQNRTFVIIGDGESQEGSVWEAVMAAANFHLDNLTVILDCNGVQEMGTVKDISGIDNWTTKWQSFGWDVESTDGHDVEALYKTLSRKNKKNLPKLIIANTVKGKGVSIMENNTTSWHYKMPSKRELKVFVKELSISEAELK